MAWSVRASALACLGFPLVVAGPLAAPLVAQAVQGRVTDAATGAPLAGALVVLVDSAGGEPARTLTYESGGFFLQARGPGRYHIRVNRIGFRGWDSPPLTLEAGRTLAYSPPVPAVQFILPDVTVVAETRCRARPETQADLAALWEQIRTALAATEETMQQGGFRFETRTWRRRLRPDLATVTEERDGGVERRLWPVRSAPAESLAAHGFVQPTSSPFAPMYYAPGTELLGEDLFLDQHCFRLVADDRSADRVGLAFRPAPDRRLPDVDGVLWVDRRTRALLAMEYRFTRLPGWAAKSSAGGGYEFAPLPNGGWVMRRWWLRAPIAKVPTGSGDLKLFGYDEEGGEVLAVLSAQGAELRRFVTADTASATPRTAAARDTVAQPLRTRRTALPDSPGYTIQVRNAGTQPLRIRQVTVAECLNIPRTICGPHTLDLELAPGEEVPLVVVRPADPAAPFSFRLRTRWETPDGGAGDEAGG